MKGVDLQ